MTPTITELKQELEQLQTNYQHFRTEQVRLAGLLQVAKKDHEQAVVAFSAAKVDFQGACVDGAGNESDMQIILKKTQEDLERSALRLQALQNAVEVHDRSVNLREINGRSFACGVQIWTAIRDEEIARAISLARESLYRAFAASQLGESHTGNWPAFLGQQLSNNNTGMPYPLMDDVKTLQDDLAKSYGVPLRGEISIK